MVVRVKCESEWNSIAILFHAILSLLYLTHLAGSPEDLALFPHLRFL